MFLILPIKTGFKAQIALRDGTIAGEGSAATKKHAMYFACLDAIHRGYPKAAVGHASFLPIRDENSIRTLAETNTMQQNPLLTLNNKLAIGAAMLAGVYAVYWAVKPAAAAAAAAPAAATALTPAQAAAAALKNAGI